MNINHLAFVDENPCAEEPRTLVPYYLLHLGEMFRACNKKAWVNTDLKAKSMEFGEGDKTLVWKTLTQKEIE